MSYFTGNQEYTCDICGHSFSFPNTLKAHIMFHCAKVASRRGTLAHSPSCRQGFCCRPVCFPAHLQPVPHRGGIAPFPSLVPNPLPSAFRPWATQEITAHPWSEHGQFLGKLPVRTEMPAMFPTPPPLVASLSNMISTSSKNFGYGVDIFDKTGLKSPSGLEIKREVDTIDKELDEITVPMYSLPMPNEKAGEPIDLLPRSLYTIKSRKGHLCIYCGKFYSRKYGLKIHLRTHTGYKPLKCKVCLRPFGDPSNLNKHIRLHAEGDTPYRCEHCGKVLVRRRDLERHIKSRHPGVEMSDRSLTQLKDDDKEVKADSDTELTSDFECEDSEEIDILS